MRVKIVWVERDFRGSELSGREEILQGESAKALTRNQVARLIARHHPELQFASRSCLWTIRGRVKVACQSQQNGF